MGATATGRRARLITVFGTVLYVDAVSGELRHGAVDGSPANAALAWTDALNGHVEFESNGMAQPIACSREGSWTASGAQARAAGLTPSLFEIATLDGGDVALRAAGLYLSAQPDGRLIRAAEIPGAAENFRPTDPSAAAEALSDLAAAAPGRIFPGGEWTRYHLGCGPHMIPGYLNLDLRQDLEGDKVYQVNNVGAFFASVDLANGLPGCDNSLEVIYHCHFLEHLAYFDAIRLLRQSRYRLKPNGRMRLVVPDLELWVDNYFRHNISFFDAYRRLALGNNTSLYATKGAVLMGMLHNHGHRWGYDFETLDWMLRELGFVNIRRTLFQESSLSEIAVIEPYTALRGMESLCVECEKPLLA